MSLVDVSRDLEVITGFDSIKTAAEHYQVYDDPSTLECPYPTCHLRRKDALSMWVHVHFSKKHGLSFDMTLGELMRMTET